MVVFIRQIVFWSSLHIRFQIRSREKDAFDCREGDDALSKQSTHVVDPMKFQTGQVFAEISLR